MLDWLDSGARPRDPVVLNHIIYHLASSLRATTRGACCAYSTRCRSEMRIGGFCSRCAIRRRCRCCNTGAPCPRPKINRKCWITRSRNSAETHTRAGGPTLPPVCCEATEECLLERVRNSATADAAAAAATAAASVATRPDSFRGRSARLAGGRRAAVEQFQIRYTDELKRSQIVRRDDGAEEKWQYLYDCWRKTEPPASAAIAH